MKNEFTPLGNGDKLLGPVPTSEFQYRKHAYFVMKSMCFPLGKLPIMFNRNLYRSLYGTDFSTTDSANCHAENFAWK